MGQARKPAYKDKRINIELKTEEEKQLYRELRAAVIQHRMTLRDVILPLMRQALTALQRKSLPPGK